MQTLSSDEILAAFVRSERKKVVLPVEPPWESLDYLGWIHRSGHLGFIVCEHDAQLKGLVLERSVVRTPGLRRFMCDLCCTLHEQGGIASFTRWNRDRTRASSHLFCADLQCSQYVRGKRTSGCVQMTETLDLSGKVERLTANLARLVTGLEHG